MPNRSVNFLWHPRVPWCKMPRDSKEGVLRD